MSTINIIRTNSENADFIKLVSLLDGYLAIRNGDANDFFAGYNKIDLIKHVVVAYHQQEPVGCGAIKLFAEGIMEVKRMYVVPEYRGQGIARKILQELETWARELHVTACVLETGKDMTDAVNLYQKSNYKVIPNYGQYAAIASSICLRKVLS